MAAPVNLNLENNLKLLTLTDVIISDKKIGEGAFGVVFRGTYLEKEVAIKHPTDGLSKLQRDALNNEVKILSSLRHKNIIIIHGGSIGNTPLLVVEYIRGGSLLKIKESKELYFFSVSKRMNFVLQILSGLEYLHEKRICHFDISLKNILLKDRMTIKLIDFGESEWFKEGSTKCCVDILAVRVVVSQIFEDELSEKEHDDDIDVRVFALKEYIAGWNHLPLNNLTTATLFLLKVREINQILKM